jgi:RND family efflux transporter MFP subunit
VDVDLSKSKLIAPFAGTISARQLDEGTIVTPGQAVLRILETGDLEIRAGVSATVAGDLEVGRKLNVRTESSRQVPAVVKRILPQRGQVTRTVDVILEGPGDSLRDGDLVSVPVETKVPDGGFWLPRMALTGSARGLWSCYVAQPAGDGAPTAMRRVERRELEILHQEGDRVFVTGGLRDGDHVVTSGVHRLVVGQLVLEATGTVASSDRSGN